jgi:UDP-N-acetylglucosamine--N-acetylmuramyl-(pentapeptide) pyrophosphoryl-undecaprenol N-acetylglucosamine transferase
MGGKSVKVAICGGGTGGHLHPLLALAEELASHDGVEITLFLSRKSPSSALLEKHRVIPLEVSGFSRGPDLRNLGALASLARAFVVCRREMKNDPPRVTVGFGGYASVPGGAAALSLGIPLVIHEQNVIPGMANRLLAARARKVAVSFARTLDVRPRWRKKAVVTGNPLLEHEVAGDRDDAIDYFELDKERKTLAVVGGSQGAASLNRAVLEALPGWRNHSDLQIIHSVGRDKYQEFTAQVAKVDTGSLLYRPLEFIERMDLLYGVADLAVCRAGASTVAELAAAGCAAVLVPYPYATAAHQDANAEVLADEGAAVVIWDRELDGSRLAEEVVSLFADEGRLERMRGAARRAGMADAAARLAELVLSQTQEGS